MTMSKMIEWFQLHYPQIKAALQRCSHSASKSEVNPYHIEDDCWSHTMMVCKVAELKGYDKVVQTAALLHDIGKPLSRSINPHNNHVRFFWHEELSAKLAKPMVVDLVMRKMLTASEADEVLELVAMHGYFYKEDDKQKTYKTFKNRLNFLKKLLQLVECDHLGRFSQKGEGRDFKQIELLVNKVEQQILSS